MSPQILEELVMQYQQGEQTELRRLETTRSATSTEACIGNANAPSITCAEPVAEVKNEAGVLEEGREQQQQQHQQPEDTVRPSPGQVSSSTLLSHLSDVSAAITRLRTALELALLETSSIPNHSEARDGECLVVSVDLTAHVDPEDLAKEVVYAYDDVDSSAAGDTRPEGAAERKAGVVDSVLQLVLALAMHSNPLCFHVQLAAVLELLPAQLMRSVAIQLRGLVTSDCEQPSEGGSGHTYIPMLTLKTFFRQLSAIASTLPPSVYDQQLQHLESSGAVMCLADCDMWGHLSVVHLAGVMLQAISCPTALPVTAPASSSSTSSDTPSIYGYLKPLAKHPSVVLQVLRAAYQLVPSGTSTGLLINSPVRPVENHLFLIEYLKRAQSELFSGALLETSHACAIDAAVAKQTLEEIATLRRVGRIPGVEAVNLKRLLLSGTDMPAVMKEG
jgi:hypothetical protein